MSLEDKIKEIMSILPPSINYIDSVLVSTTADDRYPRRYIQHIPEDVELAQKLFIELVNSELKTDFSTENINRLGILGRYIDDSGNSLLYNTWSRFMCIDNDYNEWEQPSYAKHTPKNKISLNKTNPIIKSFYRDRLIDKLIK